MSLIFFYMLTLSGIYAMIIPDSINQNMERFNHREKGSLAAEHLLEEFANEAEIDHVPSSIVPMGDDPFLMYQLLPMLETDDELNYDEDLPVMITNEMMK